MAGEAYALHVGEDFYVPLPGTGGRHLLVGGSTGAGKSMFLNLMLAEVAPMEHVAMVLTDPKRVELARWHHRATTIAKGAGSAPKVLELLVAEKRRRYECMERKGLIKVHGPCAEFPWVLAVFDEFANLARGTGSKARLDLVEELIQEGRAAGIGLVLCTQRPSADAVPGDIRDNCRVRVAFGTESRYQSEMLLGQEYRNKPHLISEDTPGVAVVKSGRKELVRRTFWLPDQTESGTDTVVAIATKWRHRRVDLGASWPHIIDNPASAAKAA